MYFYRMLRITSPEYLLNFCSDVHNYSIMVGKTFQIYGVQIPEKCIC